ncbi:iron transporter [Natrialba sp. PRR66]|uniref:iron transporter n=1 Tax=Natrialba sp. PRR66 TaxID=3098146 RepID=UPI002B1DA633|nr:iron transporter [Natrialba sp. PRR66]
MRRRDALAAGGSALSVSLTAGCLETLRREDAWRELVVDPPDGVYVPPHVDEMLPYARTTAARRELSLLGSRPHSFWTVAGAERSRADVRSRHALHLMVVVRDAETGVIHPAPVTVRIRSGGTSDDGEQIDQRDLWPMLSQRMGPHYGDNVSLDGDGTYTATIRVGPTSADPIGSLAGDFGTTTVDLEFEYEAAAIDALERRLIDADEGRGESDALEPMGDHDGDARGRDHGSAELAFDHEGATRLGSETSDDIVYVAALVEDDARTAAETDVPALAVTARTAYNRYALPFASLTATISTDGDRIAGESLDGTIGPRHGHHYRTPVDPDTLERGDTLSIGLETPPQMARHEGYETAFLEPTTVRLPLDRR